MDRERKLLCLALALAMMLEAMTVALWRQVSPDVPSVKAAQERTITCEKHLIHAWSRCSGRLRGRKQPNAPGT
jgi:hypothetical protein